MMNGSKKKLPPGKSDNKSRHYPRYLRIDQAADYLNCSIRTVYRLISDGELEAFRLKSSLRITKESINEYVTRKIKDFRDEKGW